MLACKGIFAQFQWMHTGGIHVKAKLLFSSIYQTKRCANIITERIEIPNVVLIGNNRTNRVRNHIITPRIVGIFYYNCATCVK